MKVLEEFRSENKIPIFLVIGNHDYLAAGNTAAIGDRNALCHNSIESGLESLGPNALSKSDAIELLHQFNTASAAIARTQGWEFESTINSVEQLIKACGPRHKAQDTARDCILAANLRWGHVSGRTAYAFSLLDTSNYANFDRLNPINSFRFDFRGLFGEICCGNASIGQAAWHRNQQESANAWIQILLSHYSGRDLGLQILEPGFNAAPVGRSSPSLSRLLTGKELRRTLWISAHTHRKSPANLDENLPLIRRRQYSFPTPQRMDETRPMPRFRPDRDILATFDQLNIGSTTDFVPQAAVVEPNSPNVETLTAPSANRDPWCRELVDTVSSAVFPFTIWPTMPGGQGLVNFGLTTDYRNSNWTEQMTESARANLNNLLEHFNFDLDKIACLASEVSRAESGE